MLTDTIIRYVISVLLAAALLSTGLRLAPKIASVLTERLTRATEVTRVKPTL